MIIKRGHTDTGDIGITIVISGAEAARAPKPLLDEVTKDKTHVIDLLLSLLKYAIYEEIMEEAFLHWQQSTTPETTLHQHLNQLNKEPTTEPDPVQDVIATLDTPPPDVLQ